MQNSSNQYNFEILIVDDDKIISLLHKNHIKNLNSFCAPILCSNGKQALEFLKKSNSPKKHFLIFLDLNMPVMNGWSFLETIQQENFSSTLFIVVVTSSVNSEDYNRALKFRNVVGFYRKPLTEDSIADILHLKEISAFMRRDCSAPEMDERSTPAT